MHQDLAEGEMLSLEYQSSVAAKEGVLSQAQFKDVFALELASHARAELLRGSTQVGPHRDEIKIILDKTAAREFASQGQQRTIAVSLKLAELELAKEQKGEYPVLLLDDVLSELDFKRKKRIMELPEKTQTFITAAGEEMPIVKGKKWLVEKKDQVAQITLKA